MNFKKVSSHLFLTICLICVQLVTCNNQSELSKICDLSQVKKFHNDYCAYKKFMKRTGTLLGLQSNTEYRFVTYQPDFHNRNAYHYRKGFEYQLHSPHYFRRTKRSTDSDKLESLLSRKCCDKGCAHQIYINTICHMGSGR